MLRLEKLAWGKVAFRCPKGIASSFRKICYQQTKGHIYHALIAFMYAVIQGDITLETCDVAKQNPTLLLEELADDEDNLDAFKIRIKKGGITINTTEYIPEYFYLK